MTTTIAPYRSSQRPGRDGFAQLLRAEWTKFRTVRGWAIVLVAAPVLGALATIAIAGAASAKGNYGANPKVSVDSNGQAVTDQFTFVHQTLTGNGSITVAVCSLTGGPLVPPANHQMPAFKRRIEAALLARIKLQPWAKAGIIIKASLKSGSAYAAVMATGAHGVRMQYDYTHDLAGQPGLPSASTPAWLRLTRSGDTITGYDSADGKHWTRIGSVTLAGLPATVQAGLFATSPGLDQASQGFASNNGPVISTQATGTFDHLSRQGSWPAGTWTQSQVGLHSLSIAVACGQYCARVNPTSQDSQLGAHASGAAFITAEYRRRMIRTTFAASPRRGRAIMAKVLVMGVVTFVAGLIGAAVAFEIGQSKLHAQGWGGFGLPAPIVVQRARAGDGRRHGRDLRASRHPGDRRRRRHQAQRGCDRCGHRGHHRPADPGNAAARDDRRMAAAADASRRVQRPARQSVLPASEPHLPAVQRLLPAVALVRVRRAGHLGSPFCRRHDLPHPEEGRVIPAGLRRAGRLAGLANAVHAE
jgi:hypothetical protein